MSATSRRVEITTTGPDGARRTVAVYTAPVPRILDMLATETPLAEDVAVLVGVAGLIVLVILAMGGSL